MELARACVRACAKIITTLTRSIYYTALVPRTARYLLHPCGIYIYRVMFIYSVRYLYILRGIYIYRAVFIYSAPCLLYPLGIYIVPAVFIISPAVFVNTPGHF